MRRSTHSQSEGTLEIDRFPGRSKRTLRVLLFPITREHSESVVGMVATETTRLEEASKALKDSEASLRSLSARLLQVQDEERRHLARDLHDTIGQDLTVAIMQVEKMAKDVGSPEVELRKALAECSEWLRKVESETRTLSYVLYPPLLDQLGLVAALQWYTEGFSKRSGLQVDLDVAPGVPRLPVEQETALFRAVQESLTNVLRHSGSPEARVRIALEGKNVRVSIEDKGRGFKERPSKRNSKANVGVGIPGMRGRLSLVQGRLDIQSGKKGTTISAMVPLGGMETIAADSANYPGGYAPSAQELAMPQASAVSRILIADDHEIARRGIRDLFRGESDLEICGEACDGIEALRKVEELHPDLLILDLSMPKMGGFSVANVLRNTKHRVKILIYSNHTHSGIEQMARASGCRGFIHKANAARDLVLGAKAILRGGTFYESDAAAARSV